MKTRIVVLIAAAIVIMAACNQKPEINSSKALVDSLNSVADKAWGSGDIQTVLSIYTDDAVVISGNVTMAGKDSIFKVWQNVAPYASNFQSFPGVYSVSEDMVFTEGLYTFNWKYDNKNASAKGVTKLVWKKQPDKTWKITYHEEAHGTR